MEDWQSLRLAILLDMPMSALLWQGYCTRLERQGRSLWTTAHTIQKWKNLGEREALLIGVPEKEENHGDHTTA
jgi:hypothetical protein